MLERKMFYNMVKEYRMKDINKSDFENDILTAIKFYKVIESDFTFKFKFVNFKNKKMNIIALSDITKVNFDDDFKKVYINFNEEYIIINLEKYDSITIEFESLNSSLSTTLIMNL